VVCEEGLLDELAVEVGERIGDDRGDAAPVSRVREVSTR